MSQRLAPTEETTNLYERLPDEPNIWYARFLLFRDQKPARRSMLAAACLYQQQASNSPKKPYKHVPGAWKEAAEKWRWKERAEAYDKAMQEEAEERARLLREIEAAEIERILTTDYAAKHNRVAALAKMAHDIEASLLDPETGKINPKWLYPDKIREWRGCFDDIAKELGERQKKVEHAGKDGGPILFVTEWGGGVVIDEEEEEQAG